MGQNFIYNLQSGDYPMSRADRARLLRSVEYPVQGWDTPYNNRGFQILEDGPLRTPRTNALRVIPGEGVNTLMGNRTWEPFVEAIDRPGSIKGFGSTLKPPSYNIGSGIGQAPLQGYVSNTPEDIAKAKKVAEALDTLTKDTKPLGDTIKQSIKTGKVNPLWKYTPIISDVYDVPRGIYRMTHGSPIGGALQTGVGLFGLGTLGVGSLAKSGGKALFKLGAKQLPKAAYSLSEALGEGILRNQALQRNGALLRGMGSKLSGMSKYTHNWPVWAGNGVWDFFDYFKPKDNEVKMREVKEPGSNGWTANSFSTMWDKPLTDYDLPSLDYLDNEDLSEYDSWLNNRPPSESLDFGETNPPQYTLEDFKGALRELGYTDDAINDAVKGNYNGMPEMKSNIEAYNKVVPEANRIKIIEPEEEQEPLKPIQVNEDGAFDIGIETEDTPDIDNLEYLEALADIDNIVDSYDKEYKPYLEGLSSYLNNYDKLWRNYLGLKRYYAGLSNMSGDSSFNRVPEGLDPRDIEATRLDLYKKLADDRLALDNKQRELRGNVELAQALGYPARGAFASKDMLQAFSNAKLADSRIKATEAIAQLKADNDMKIAEMNNKRAMEVAKLNGANAMQRVKYQQNEANYRKTLDIRQKELDRKLEVSKQIGNWREARLLKQYSEVNANKRAAVNALSNYMTYGTTGNGMTISDIVRILGEDIYTLVKGINARSGNNSEEAIAAEIENNE